MLCTNLHVYFARRFDLGMPERIKFEDALLKRVGRIAERLISQIAIISSFHLSSILLPSSAVSNVRLAETHCNGTTST